MTLSIVPPFYGDATFDPPPTEDQLELARTALTCLQGGDTAPRKRGNSATRLSQVRVRLFAAMAEGNRDPLIDDLLRIADGDYDPVVA